MGAPLLNKWFVDRVLPYEAALETFIRRRGAPIQDMTDIRQEVYVRTYRSAQTSLPRAVKPFLFQVARNLITDRIRREKLACFVQLEADEAPHHLITPEQEATARQDISKLQADLQSLPDRCRQVVMLRKIAGLSQKETAKQLGIAEATVEKQTSKAMRLLQHGMQDRGHGRKLRRKTDGTTT